MKNTGESKVEFIERKFEEVEGGYYDDSGFYITPDGSKFTKIIIKGFWDDQGYYFNKDGYDITGIKIIKCQYRWIL
jgi:hypothetical protein